MTDATIRIWVTALNLMLDAAQRAAPQECGGVLLGAPGDPLRRRGHFVHSASSVAARYASKTAYALDELALLREEQAARDRKQAVLGYFHSHPRATSADLAPSHADRSGELWPGLGPRLRVIVAPGGAWRAYVADFDGWRGVFAKCAQR